MYSNMQEFVEGYGWESGVTASLLDNLTQESLSVKKADGHNTLGELAYHVATSPAMMMRDASASSWPNRPSVRRTWSRGTTT